jgi:hypothetical protein
MAGFEVIIYGRFWVITEEWVARVCGGRGLLWEFNRTFAV